MRPSTTRVRRPLPGSGQNGDFVHLQRSACDRGPAPVPRVLEQTDGMDMVIAPIGGGGMVSHLNPSTLALKRNHRRRTRTGR